jgi:Mg2+ and Co2+ transporter CorA
MQAPMPVPPQQAAMPGQYDRAKSSAAKGFAIAGFILAVIGLFVVVWQYNRYLSPFGTVGLVMSVVGLLIPEKGEDRNRATYIFSVVGIIISVLALIATLVIGIFGLQPFTY